MSSSSDGVVDVSLKVKEVAGLRVADASIMPRVISGISLLFIPLLS